MRNVSDTTCRENQGIIFSVTFFENLVVVRYCGKYCTAGRPQIIWCKRNWMPDSYSYTHAAPTHNKQYL